MRHFVEISGFRHYLDSLDDGQKVLREVQSTLVENPLAGDLIVGTGGLRKLRASGKGKGKSGGYRIWYLYF